MVVITYVPGDEQVVDTLKGEKISARGDSGGHKQPNRTVTLTAKFPSENKA